MKKFTRFIEIAPTGIAFLLSFFVYFSSFHGARASAPSESLFEQSSLDGATGNYLVPLAGAGAHRPPSNGVFHIILWQPNPNRSDGMLVPTGWSAGDKTGFYPSAPVEKHQAGFRDASGASTLQIDGDVVGAYLNSADLPAGSHGYKMMMTPEMSIEPGAQVHPFAKPGRAVVVTLDLQVPVAADGHNSGSRTYVSADLLMVDSNSGTKISYGCNLFFNGHPQREPIGHIRLDEDSHSMMINSVVGLHNPWLTAESGSAINQSTPWKGWKTFKFAITERDFIQALHDFSQQYPGAKTSFSPADYTFAKFHLNAELTFQSAPAELGWSMRHVKIEIVDSTQVM
jgi:hypothetical protein